MKLHTALLFGLLGGLFLLSSCSKNLMPFTEQLKSENDWQEADLKRIQFYLSDDLVIHREAKNVSSKINDGKIKMKKGREVEEIVIPRGTPGVLVEQPKKRRLGISFDDRDDAFFVFRPNPNRNGVYVVGLAEKWRKGKGLGKIEYADTVYYIDRESAQVFLQVDMKHMHKTSVIKRKAKGRKID